MINDIYATAARENGEIIFQGKHYALLAQAALTNRLFDGGWNPYLRHGEEYISEWSAPAIGQDGEEYIIVWRFSAVKGQEPEDNSNWPWGEIYEVISV